MSDGQNGREKTESKPAPAAIPVSVNEPVDISLNSHNPNLATVSIRTDVHVLAQLLAKPQEACVSEPHETGAVLITGCSSGLGHATARAFHAAGFSTIATARNETQLDDLRALGCETLTLEVTDESSRRAAVETAEQRHGAIGVLVNNAGYGQYGPIEEIPLDAVRRAFETNVFAYVRMAQLVLPSMRRAGRGRIINVSSLAGRVTAQGGGVYHMTKYALEALADALRPEVKPFGIDVVSILPGPFVSNYRDKIIGSIPDTGAGSPYATYKRNLGKWMHEFLTPGRFGVMTSEQVAKIILKAGTAERPRTRYNVGFWAHFGPIGRALTPDRVVDAYTSREMHHR
jgi:NAD(P)-dependent dehydrogenase (short-subunit alcohol dehydrogenase family)